MVTNGTVTISRSSTEVWTTSTELETADDSTMEESTHLSTVANPSTPMWSTTENLVETMAPTYGMQLTSEQMTVEVTSATTVSHSETATSLTNSTTNWTSASWTTDESTLNDQQTSSSTTAPTLGWGTTLSSRIPTSLGTTETSRPTDTSSIPTTDISSASTATTAANTTTTSSVVTTTSTTTSSVATSSTNTLLMTTLTPKPTLLPTVPPKSVLYPQSSNYHFPDLNTNMTSTAEDGVEVVPGPFGFGSAVEIASSNDGCLHRTQFYSDQDQGCFRNPGNCSSGISVSIWENVLFSDADREDRYILSTGGDKDGMPGVALYHKGVDLHAVVSNGSHYWYLYAMGPVPNNTWSNIGMKWKDSEGLEIYVDEERIGKVVYPTRASSVPNDGIDPPEIAVGCHIRDEPRQYTNISNGKFDELAIWLHSLNETELIKFLGGYGRCKAGHSHGFLHFSLSQILRGRLQQYVNRELPEVQAGFRSGRGTRDQIANVRWIMEKAKEYQKPIYLCFIDNNAVGANMSVEDLENIIKNKMNLSDPEQHQQAVSILSKMTENKGDSSSSSSSSPSLGAATEVTVSSPPSSLNTANSSGTGEDNVTVDYSQPESSSPQTTDISDGTSALNEAVDKLQTVSDIVQLMAKPDNIKLKMTPDEMGAFQDLLQVVSNMFGLDKKQEWLKIQELKNGSSAVVEVLQTWAMALLKQAEPKRKSKSFQYTKTTDNIVLTTTKLTVREFDSEKGITTPNYGSSEWAGVPWSKGTPRLPLDTITFSREMFNDLGRKPDSDVFIVNFLFSTYDDIAPRNVNAKTLPQKNIFLDSKVITATMEPTRGLDYSLYTHPIVVTLAHNKNERTLRKMMFHDENHTIPTIKTRYCARWNPEVFPYGGWDSSGCEMYHSSEEYTVCHCEHLGSFAIIAQNMLRRMIYPDRLWLRILKYTFYGLSVLFLIIYILTILFSKHLKDQFHIIRLNMALATLAGTGCMVATDYVRNQRHECTAVTAVLHYAYVAVSCWLLMESHAIFSAMMHGTIGGRLKAYILFSWGCPMIFLGLAFLTGFQDYGLEPRCMVSWNDEMKWSLFGPNLAFGVVALLMTVASIVNTSFAAVKKEVIFEDLSSVAWGLLLIELTFDLDWAFACLAYLDIELMYPDFYPIFQVLNASLGFMIFLFMGIGSKRFRMVLRCQAPDKRHLPLVNCKPEDLIEVNSQSKHKE